MCDSVQGGCDVHTFYKVAIVSPSLPKCNFRKKSRAPIGPSSLQSYISVMNLHTQNSLLLRLRGLFLNMFFSRAISFLVNYYWIGRCGQAENWGRHWWWTWPRAVIEERSDSFECTKRQDRDSHIRWIESWSRWTREGFQEKQRYYTKQTHHWAEAEARVNTEVDADRDLEAEVGAATKRNSK